MGATHSKTKCLILNAQGGKTRRVQDMIREMDAANPDSYFHFVIQANNRSLVEQTGARMKNDLYAGEEEAAPSDAKIEGNCFSWYSGGPNKSITAKDLAARMLEGVSMVICCANRRRLTYIKETVETLETILKRTRSPLKICFWLDEADAYMNFWSDLDFRAVVDKPLVESVTMVTATPDAIVKRFGSMTVIPLETPTLPIYFGAKDYKVELVPYKKQSALEFVKEHVEGNPERYLQPGARLFVPGDVARKSHYAISNFFLSHGAAVIVLNGEKKEIWIPKGAAGKDIIALPRFGQGLDAAEEIGRQIARLYAEQGLAAYPLAITGNICLSRGITFQNDGFLFDHLILPDVFDDRASAYQAAGRGMGNIRALRNFLEREATGFVPTLLTVKPIWDFIEQAENIASTIAKKAYATGSTRVTSEELEIASGNKMLEKSEVPIVLKLTDALAAITLDRRRQSEWTTAVLTEIAVQAPELHAELSVGEWVPHVNNYCFGTPNYKSKCRERYNEGRAGLRAPVPTDDWDLSRNIWYAALDQTFKHLVICRFLGASA